MEIANRAWRLRPAYTFQLDLGDLLLRAGRPDLAIQVLGLLVEEAPSYADARIALATALRRAGRSQDARRLLLDGAYRHPADRRFTTAESAADRE